MLHVKQLEKEEQKNTKLSERNRKDQLIKKWKRIEENNSKNQVN